MIPEHELHSMYWDNGMSQREIGELYGITGHSVSYWMKKYGIATRTISEALSVDSKILQEAELRNMYINDGMNLREIGDIVGVSNCTVRDWMKKYKIKARTISESQLGEKNPRWKNGISSEPYCYKFNDTFKEDVRKRDDYTCQLCGLYQEQNGRKLDVHHIHYDKPNCWPDVVALCRSCNSRVNADRDYWEEHFENHLIERELFCWSISQEMKN